MTPFQSARRRSASGCSLWVDRAAWREEVQLATGEMVVVGRVAVADKSEFPVPRRGPHRRWQITFPDGKTAWESDGLTQPLSIEVCEGRYFLAADIHSPLLCAKYGEPQGSVVFFRWEDGAWKNIPRQAYPRSSRVNLLRDPWGRDASEDAQGLIRHQDKHLRAGNHLVHVALDERIANRARDSWRPQPGYCLTSKISQILPPAAIPATDASTALAQLAA